MFTYRLLLLSLRFTLWAGAHCCCGWRCWCISFRGSTVCMENASVCYHSLWLRWNFHFWLIIQIRLVNWDIWSNNTSSERIVKFSKREGNVRKYACRCANHFIKHQQTKWAQSWPHSSDKFDLISSIHIHWYTLVRTTIQHKKWIWRLVPTMENMTELHCYRQNAEWWVIFFVLL